MNSKNSKTFDFHTPLHNLSDTIDLKRTDKYVLLRNLSIYLLCMGKCNIKIINLKYQIQCGTGCLNYLTDHFLCQISDIPDYFEYIIKKHDKLTDNALVRIYENKIENMVIFKFKTVCYHKHLTPGTMKTYVI